MIEFDAINTGDIKEFTAWLNKRSAEGWVLLAFQIQNGPNCPAKPFTALVQRENGAVGVLPGGFPKPGERGS